MPHMPGDALDFDRLWLPYIYLYAVGGALFLGGLFLVLRSGALDMKRRHLDEAGLDELMDKAAGSSLITQPTQFFAVTALTRSF